MADNFVGTLALKAETKDLDKANEALDELGGQIPLVGEAFAALKHPITIAVAAVTGLSTATYKLIDATEEWEQQQAQVNAILQATGQASGLTAREIDSLVGSIEETTMSMGSEIELAVKQLLTFKAVTSETFEETLRLSQDLSSIGFGSVAANAVRLGKALEDPIRGLGRLRLVGVSFTATQEEMIKNLVKTGDQLTAQKEILRVVAEQVGGAGAAQQIGLRGATHRLGAAWDEMLETLGQTGPIQTARDALVALTDAATSALKGVTDLADVQTYEELQEKAVQLEEKISNLRSSVYGRMYAGKVKQMEEELLAIKKELGDRAVRDEQEHLDKMGYAWTNYHKKLREEQEAADRERRKILEEQAIWEGNIIQDREDQMRKDKEAASKRARAIINADKERGRSITENVLTPQEKYNQQIQELDGLLDRNRITQETYNRAVANYKDELQKATDSTHILGLATRDWQQIGVDTFAQVIRGGATFSDVLYSISEQIALMTARMIIFGDESKKATGGTGGNGWAGLFATIATSLASNYASGGVTDVTTGFAPGTSATEIYGFADGGSAILGGRPGVDKNILSLNNVPVARVSKGERMTISPNQMGSGGTVINNSITIVQQEGEDQDLLAQRVLKHIEASQKLRTNDAIADQLRPGNILNPVTKPAF